MDLTETCTVHSVNDMMVQLLDQYPADIAELARLAVTQSVHLTESAVADIVKDYIRKHVPANGAT